jgi:hypothetical protein
MRRMIPAVLVLLMLAGCSSGPSPMQQWQAGKGGKDLTAVHMALKEVVRDTAVNAEGVPVALPQALANDGAALFVAAANATANPPPVDRAAYKKVMGDYVGAGLALSRFSDPTANVTTITQQAENGLGVASDAMKGAPWASQL